MENTENVNWLWPFKGGTWKERKVALAYAVILALMLIAIYRLSWTMASYF